MILYVDKVSSHIDFDDEPLAGVHCIVFLIYISLYCFCNLYFKAVAVAGSPRGLDKMQDPIADSTRPSTWSNNSVVGLLACLIAVL
jgi:hypothetical protein